MNATSPLAIADASRSYFERVDALMQATAHDSVEAAIEACAALFQREPWRMNRVFAAATVMTPTELIICVHRRLQHPVDDFNRWIGLKALLRVAREAEAAEG